MALKPLEEQSELAERRHRVEEEVRQIEEKMSGILGADFRISSESRKTILKNNGVAKIGVSEGGENVGGDMEGFTEEKILENLGIFFYSEPETTAPLQDQLNLIRYRRVKRYQIEFQPGKLSETESMVIGFDDEYIEGKTSFCLSVFGVDKNTGKIINPEEKYKEVEASLMLGSEIITLRPFGENIDNLSPENKKVFWGEFCSFLADAVKKALDFNKETIFLVMNSPVSAEKKGEISGDSPEGMKEILSAAENILIKKNIGPELSRRRIGVGLNLRNASVAGEKTNMGVAMIKWADFRERIGCFYLYVPENPGREYNDDFSEFLKAYKGIGFNVPIFLENEQPLLVLEAAYMLAERNPEIAVSLPPENGKIGLGELPSGGVEITEESKPKSPADKSDEEGYILKILSDIYREAGEIKKKFSDDRSRAGALRDYIGKNHSIAEFMKDYEADVLIDKALEAASDDKIIILGDLRSISPDLEKKLKNH